MRYRFAGLELDTRSLELTGPAGPVPLEPLAFEALAYLVEHRDRVVPKDELAQVVWRAEFVSDAAITRCVSVARKAIRAAGCSDRVLLTVYGRGYRFVAPLESDGGGGSEELAPETTVERARPAWALVIALLVALGLVLVTRAERPGEPPAGVRTLEVSLEGTEDRELALVGLSMLDLLRLRLADDPTVRVVTGGEAEATAGGARPDLRLVLALRPAPWDGHARLEATLLTPADGGGSSVLTQELPLLRSNVSLEAFSAVREALASEVARHLGLALVGGGEGREPHDAAAWRLYLEALAELDVACDVDGPRRRLQDSVRLDPGFAPAWYLLAGTELQRANLCAGSPADYEAATAAAAEARRLAPDWAAPEQLACGILLHQGRVEEAMERALAARERFPDHPFVRLRLSEILRYAGLLERSRAEFETVLASDPAAALQTDVIPYPYLYLERWDRFLDLLPGGTSPYHRYYRAWAELQRGSPGQAREILRPGARTAGRDAFGDLGDALLALLEDRPEDAAELLVRLAADRERRGIGDGELTFKIARLLLEAGEPDEAVRLFDVAARQGFFCPSCLTTPPIADRLRATPDYPRLVRRVEARHEQFARRFAEPLGPDPRVPLAGSLP